MAIYYQHFGLAGHHCVKPSGKKIMRTSCENIVADGETRIRESKEFSRRMEEIRQTMIQSRQAEINSAGWLSKRLILWKIRQASLRHAEAELCSPEALYLKTK